MTNDQGTPTGVDELLAVASDALESDHFKAFLDHIPIAVAVAEIRGNSERIIFSNIEFERLTGLELRQVQGRRWNALDSHVEEDQPQRSLGRAVLEGEEFLGTFRLERGESGTSLADAYANIIQDDNGEPKFRLLALVDVTTRERSQREKFEQQIREKDLLLKELQHRVKNNLQLITALIRLEARTSRSEGRLKLDRLAGRIESLQLLYHALLADGRQQEIDLGHYLGQIASAAMSTHGLEGIRLDLKVDYLPISINVAMPVGLLVNELLTNAFKYAFKGRATGTITLTCLRQEHERCHIVVADDGIGLPESTEWPPRGKIAALMLQSLHENTKTEWKVETAPNRGTRITFLFALKSVVQHVEASDISLSGPFLVEPKYAPLGDVSGKRPTN
jgi:PAS domain S-box-containing protein